MLHHASVAVMPPWPTYSEVCVVMCTCVQALRVEMGAALAAGSADLEGRERAVREAERRLAEQQVRQRHNTARCNMLRECLTPRMWVC
jgi:hypothetical protein